MAKKKPAKWFRILVERAGGGTFVYRPDWNKDGMFRWQRATQVRDEINSEGGKAKLQYVQLAKATDDERVAFINKWCDGDIYIEKGSSKEHVANLVALLYKVAMVGKDVGQVVDVVSGYRTKAEQQRLYNMWLAGTGNLAAIPGTSNHEKGRAADCYINGVALNSYAPTACKNRGLVFPVGGEAWHAELA